MTKHSQPADCLKFLEEENSAETGRKETIIKRFGNTLDHGCLDEFLNIFTRYVTCNDDVYSICKYLRSYRIFDQSDQDRIFNDSVFNTPEKKATELLTEIGKRGRHGYWFLAHALKKQGPKHMRLFNYFHGKDFRCCVCKDIELRELEEQLVDLDCDSDVSVENAIACFLSMMKAFKEMVEEKCTTVKERAKERMRNKTYQKTHSDPEDAAVTPNPLDEEFEPDLGKNAHNEGTDLSGEVTARASASSIIKDFRKKVSQQYSKANEVLQRKRKRFNANTKESLDDDNEGTTQSTQLDKSDKPNKQQTEKKQLFQDNVVPTAEGCIVIPRKQAYKAAFLTLSAATLFSFYPLPPFDFIFLFLYCNLLMLLISF